MTKHAFALGIVGSTLSPAVLAGVNNAFLVPVSAPTLGEVGLGLLVVLLGAVGGFFARRKK